MTADTSGSGVTINGDILNTTSKTLDGGNIVVAIRDQNGQLISVAWTNISPSKGLLAPKATLAWSLSTQIPAKLDPKSLTYDTIIQAHVHQ